MSVGNGNISFTELPSKSGSPFSAGSAANGLSVSTGLGNTPAGVIQLGNLLGDAGQQAKLLDIMEVPMNGQQLRFTNAGVGDQTIVLSTGFFIFLDNGVSTNQTSISPGQISLTCDDYNTIAGGTIQINDTLTATALDLTLENLGGLANFTIDITDGGGFRQTLNKNLLTITGAYKSGDPGGGAGFWKFGHVKNVAVALDGTKYLEVNVDGAIIKLGIVA